VLVEKNEYVAFGGVGAISNIRRGSEERWVALLNGDNSERLELTTC
jgi:hypothetical protein